MSVSFPSRIPDKQLDDQLLRAFENVVAEAARRDLDEASAVPLQIAYCLFKIDRQLQDDPEPLKERLKNVMRMSVQSSLPPRDAAFAEQFEGLVDRSPKMLAMNEYQSLAQFLRLDPRTSDRPGFFAQERLTRGKDGHELVSALYKSVKEEPTGLPPESERSPGVHNTAAAPPVFVQPERKSVFAVICQRILPIAWSRDRSAAPETSGEIEAISPKAITSKGEPVATIPAVAVDKSKPPRATVIECQIDHEEYERIAQSVIEDRNSATERSDDATHIAVELSKALRGGMPPHLFAPWQATASDRVLIVREIPPDCDLWFIGDIHGDLLSLRLLLRYAQSFSDQARRRATFLLLGDLIDDGELGHLVLRDSLTQLLQDHDLTILAGNHDESLNCDASTEQFSSGVDPCEFAHWLNALPPDSGWRKLAEVSIDFFRVAPRAVFLPGGVLATHGGVPLPDLLPSLQTASDLNHPSCLQDFVWTRASDTVRRRIPNRTTRGCSFGSEDLDDFAFRATQLVGQPVTCLIRGHEHEDQRFHQYENCVKTSLLTINAMCHRLEREILGPYERTPCLARWRSDSLPEIHRLTIPPQTIRRVYPEPANDPA